MTRRGVLVRAGVVLAVLLGAVVGTTAAHAADESGTTPTSIVIGADGPATSIVIGGSDGNADAQGDPADGVPRGELDELGVLLMGRHAQMPEVKPPDFFSTADGQPPDPTKPSGPPYKTGPSATSPVVTPPPALGAGDGTIYAVGDSVLLGTESYLPSTTAGWDLRMDAVVGRTFPGGITAITSNRSSVGQVAVVVLGHNYGGGNLSAGYIDQVVAGLSKAQRIVFVTVTEWQPAQAEVNRNIYAAAAKNPKIVVAPWAETVAANPDFLVDNVHPNTAGRVALSNLIAVMVGPVPPSDGRPKPPRPVILPIPPTSGTTTTTAKRTTTTTARPTVTTTAPPPVSPTTPVPTTPAPTTTTTLPPTSTTQPLAPP